MNLNELQIQVRLPMAVWCPECQNPTYVKQVEPGPGEVLMHCPTCFLPRAVAVVPDDQQCVREVMTKLDAPDEIRQFFGEVPERPKVKGVYKPK